jgi:hypothetical protein
VHLLQVTSLLRRKRGLEKSATPHFTSVFLSPLSLSLSLSVFFCTSLHSTSALPSLPTHDTGDTNAERCTGREMMWAMSVSATVEKEYSTFLWVFFAAKCVEVWACGCVGVLWEGG